MSEENTLQLNGRNFVTFPKVKELYPTNSLGVNLDLNVGDWNADHNTQIIGNYGGQGWGLFLETGQKENFSLSIVDCGNNQLLLFNNDCGYRLQRELPTTNITAQAVDGDNSLYVFDGSNNTIYIFDQYGVEINTIKTNTTNTVNVMKILSNRIFILEEGVGVHEISQGGVIIETTPLEHDIHNNFVVCNLTTDSYDINTVITKECTPVLKDCDETYYHIHGINLYKNGIPFFTIGEGVNGFSVDSNDDIVVVYQNNRILKITTQGLKIFDRQFHEITSRLNRENCDNVNRFNKVNINHTKLLTEEGLKTFSWILYEEGGYVLLVNDDGTLEDCFPLSRWLDTENFSNIILNDMRFCYNGDFTSNNANRVNCRNENTTFLRFRMFTRSRCDDSISSHELSYNVSGLNENNNIQATFDGRVMRLLVNGSVVDSIETSGEIYYDETNLRPLIIGAESGRFTALKTEEGVGDSIYLRGVIGNLSIYETSEIPLITSGFETTSSVNLELPVINQRNFTETIEQFFMMRPSGFKSSRMDIEIINSESTQRQRTKLLDVIEEVIPSEVILDEVKFSDKKCLADLI